MAVVYLTRTAAAKHVGVTYQEIKRALDRGELKLYRNKLDLDLVERLFAVKKLKIRKNAAKPKQPKQTKQKKSAGDSIPIDSDKFKDSAEALFRKMKAEARLKELELQEKKGNLFSVETYKQMAFEWARNIRDQVEAIPHRMQGMLSKEQTAVLKNEIRNILESISG